MPRPTDDTVRRRLQSQAQRGNAQAQHELGCLYDSQPRPRRERAFAWHYRAALQGHAAAQNAVGEGYREGLGVLADQSRAVEWFASAAALGNPLAQLSLGVCYFEGNGVPQDHLRAGDLYRASAACGNTSAHYNLAQMYRTGKGVSQCWNSALRHYEIAAQKNHVDAAHWLARIADGDEEPEPDAERAVFWLTSASELGDPASACSLGVRYHHGDGVDRDYKRAAQLYRFAAEHNELWAMFLLGLCYRDGLGVRRNRRWARQWLVRAANEHQEAREALTNLDC